LFRAVAIAAVLLLAALVTAPAYAQDTGGGTTTPPVDTTTPPTTPPTTTDPAPAPTPTPTPDPVSQPPADPPPSSDASPPADPGSSQPSSQPPSDAGSRQPARPSSGDESTTPTAAAGSSTPAPTSSTPTPRQDLTGPRGSDTWLGQDTFIVSKTVTKRDGGVTTVRRRFAGLFLLGSSTKATRSEAKARRAHETAKVSAIGGGPPKPGDPLPSQNPFFNLLSGPSGIAAGLMMASMLAVLFAAFVFPRDRSTAFRTPRATWSPLAYVPPIELPG
jgi:outer membrane biosynthesis protein TonB